MIQFNPRPRTHYERLLFVAGVCGGLSAAQELTEDQLALLEAHELHRQDEAALREQLDSLLANQPPKPVGSGETASQMAQALAEWKTAVRDTQWLLVQCDRCFHDPLDSEFGEQARARNLAHWGQPRALGLDTEEGQA